MTFLHRLIAPTSLILMLSSGACHAAPVGKTRVAAKKVAVAKKAAPIKVPAVTLAQDGKALFPVVIGVAADAQTKIAAEELAKYLGQISGATFEVKTADAKTDASTRGLLVGTLSDFPDVKLSAAQKKSIGMRGRFDGREAFLIDTSPQRILLLGNTPMGASHAVYALLESLGCRWFFPSKAWEIVPRTRTLQAALKTADRPAILSRRIWYGFGFFDVPAIEDYTAWARRNRMAQSLEVNAGHAWQTIIADNAKTFEEHPEYRALVGGKRQGEQLCVSNAGLRKLAIDWALQQFVKNPALDMVPMETSDGLGHCECDQCAKLGSISDRVFGLANEVAEAVEKKYPGRMVGLYAYAEHSEPPSFALRPNVHVQLTAGFIYGRYSYDELLRLWPKKNPHNMGYYEYFSVYFWDFDMLLGGRAADVKHLAHMVRDHAENGAVSISAESGNNWGVHGRGYYLANKLMWKPSAPAAPILADFYVKAFGKAAPAMRSYYERVDPANVSAMTQNTMAQAFRDVQKATMLAAADAPVQARLDEIKGYLRFVQLQWQMDRLAELQGVATPEEVPAIIAQRKALWLQRMTHAYRTRRTYANHVWAMMFDDSLKAAAEFKEPTWAFVYGAPLTQPWAVEAPIEHAETEKLFQEGLDYFQPQPYTAREYSQDLVQVDFPDQPEVATFVRTQGALQFALNSSRGEPIVLQVRMRTIYKDKSGAKYIVTDKDGKKVGGAVLPADAERHDLKIEVPRAGTYFVRLDDGESGMEVGLDGKLAAALVLEPGPGGTYLGIGGYFYVPKNTTRFDYIALGGRRNVGSSMHLLHRPGGETPQRNKRIRQTISVQVAPEEAGKVWRISEMNAPDVIFYNLPNVLSLSPRRMLIPREVAARDGLLSVR